VRQVARLPLQDSLPIEFDATRTGPRSIGWRSDRDATLKWVEAQDGGDPVGNPDTAPRDVVFSVDLSERGAGDGGAPQRLAATDLRCAPPTHAAHACTAPRRRARAHACRYGGIAWCDGGLALLYESWWQTRRSRVWVIAPDDPGAPPQLLFDRSYEDIYSDPGSPLYVRHPRLGTSVLARIDGLRKLLMLGAPMHACAQCEAPEAPPAAMLRVQGREQARRAQGHLWTCWTWTHQRRRGAYGSQQRRTTSTLSALSSTRPRMPPPSASTTSASLCPAKLIRIPPRSLSLASRRFAPPPWGAPACPACTHGGTACLTHGTSMHELMHAGACVAHV
jgi:hypothetical protein